MFLSQFFFKSQTPPPKKADQTKSAPGGPAAPAPAAPAQSPPVEAAANRCHPAVPPTLIASPARLHHRYRSVPHRPAATRAAMSAAGSSRNTKATTTSPWNWSIPSSGLAAAVLALLSRARSRPPTSTGPGTRRPAIPTASASRTSSPMATPPSARPSASRRTATSRMSAPKSPSTASRCPVRSNGAAASATSPLPTRRAPAARSTSTPGSQQARDQSVGDAKSGPVDVRRQLLLRRTGRHLLRGRLPAAGQHASRKSRLSPIRCAPRSKRSRRPSRALPSPTAPRTISSSSSAPRISTCSTKHQSQADPGGGFRLAVGPRQAALPPRQLVQRLLRPQLRLVHRPGDHRHQLHPVPAQALQHEVDAQDAGAQAADRRHQRASIAASK